MPANPDICECGSQLFVAVWSVELKEDAETDEETVLNPKEGNTVKKPVGFECRECGSLQLTREIPKAHADNESLDLPESADRDMVREE